MALTLVVTCVAVYQSGSKSTPNEKEFVKEYEKDSVDEAIKTEEREEEETEDANTSDVERNKSSGRRENTGRGKLLIQKYRQQRMRQQRHRTRPEWQQRRM